MRGKKRRRWRKIEKVEELQLFSVGGLWIHFQHEYCAANNALLSVYSIHLTLPQAAVTRLECHWVLRYLH